MEVCNLGFSFRPVPPDPQSFSELGAGVLVFRSDEDVAE